MLAKRLRLPAEALKDTRGFAKRSSPFFVARSKSNGLTHARFAVIVSAKVDRSSVARHNMKRRISARLWSLLRNDRMDVVVTVLPAAKTLDRKAFSEALEKILQ